MLARVPLGPHDPYWKKLYEVLAELSRTAGGAFAYVIDDGNALWCAASPGVEPTTKTDKADRAADRFYAKEIVPRIVAMRRGKPFDVAKVDGDDRYVGVSFAGIYVVVVGFEGDFDAALVRARIRRALPAIEALTLDLPPPEGPVGGERGGKLQA
jgi:hypothetical protein